MRPRDWVAKWKPAPETLPPSWALWVTVILVACLLGIPTSFQWSSESGYTRPSQNGPTPVPTIGLGTPAWSLEGDRMTLEMEYSYDGRLPASALLTAFDVEGARGFAAFWIRVEDGQGDLRWSLTCDDIFAQRWEQARPESGAEFDFTFDAGFYPAPRPTVRSPFAVHCVVP